MENQLKSRKDLILWVAGKSRNHHNHYNIIYKNVVKDSDFVAKVRVTISYEVTIEGEARECVAKKYAFAGLLRLFLLDFTLSVGNVR